MRGRRVTILVVFVAVTACAGSGSTSVAPATSTTGPSATRSGPRSSTSAASSITATTVGGGVGSAVTVPSAGTWPTTNRPGSAQLLEHLSVLPAVDGVTAVRITDMAAIRADLGLAASQPLTRVDAPIRYAHSGTQSDSFLAISMRSQRPAIGIDPMEVDWWASVDTRDGLALGVASGTFDATTLRSLLEAEGAKAISVDGVDVYRADPSASWNRAGLTAVGIDEARRRVWYSTVEDGAARMPALLAAPPGGVAALPGMSQVIAGLGPAYSVRVRGTFVTPESVFRPFYGASDSGKRAWEALAVALQADAIPEPRLAGIGVSDIGPDARRAVAVEYDDAAAAAKGLAIARANLARPELRERKLAADVVESHVDGALAVTVLSSWNDAELGFADGRLPLLWAPR